MSSLAAAARSPSAAAFGVMTIVGPRGAGHVEVTTFRTDAAYTDGRHPAGVTFSTPEEDAQRRDFTINGLFFDPLIGKVHDYVGEGPISSKASCGRLESPPNGLPKTISACCEPCVSPLVLDLCWSHRRVQRSNGWLLV